MLEKVQTLSDSVSLKQLQDLRKTLGEDLFALLDSALDAETQGEAEARVSAFVSAAKKSPLKILKARKLLTDAQRDIVMGFIEGD